MDTIPGGTEAEGLRVDTGHEEWPKARGGQASAPSASSTQVTGGHPEPPSFCAHPLVLALSAAVSWPLAFLQTERTRAGRRRDKIITGMSHSVYF